ncbi:unnamed protein product, partial [Brenthis ino]
MKRRNAESGKMRRPVKRNKLNEGMYGNSLLYLKFIMLWATVVLADYMLEFRFEFLWPFWMMIKSVYDSFKYHGVASSVFFICIALTSDMICFFFVPLEYVFFAASTYVWVQYVLYTFADKGICLPTVALCCLVVYSEGVVRARTVPLELWRPLAAHCLGYPVLSLGFGVKNAQKEECKAEYTSGPAADARHMNGSVRRRCARDHNGVCVAEHPIQVKLDKLERNGTKDKAPRAPYSNGAAGGPGAPDADDRTDAKGGGKPVKCEKKEASTVREDKKKHKNKDKDSSDSHKSTEQTKEFVVKEKEVESTKECVKSNKDSNSHKEKEKDKREEKGKIKEEEVKEREKWLMVSYCELTEELKRVREELTAARSSEAEARRALAARPALPTSERVALERRLSEERRARAAAEHQLQRARSAASRAPTGECDNEWCRSRRGAHEADAAAARRELQRARDRAALLQRDLALKTDQVRSLEARAARADEGGSRLAACAALQERAAYLERSLSAETRVKLDLLSALGDAKRHMQIQEGLISRQEKEIEELKAQMLAVMPTEFVTPVSGTVSKLRLSDGSPLDPNASVYTPKQLCSDA